MNAEVWNALTNKPEKEFPDLEVKPDTLAEVCNVPTNKPEKELPELVEEAEVEHPLEDHPADLVADLDHPEANLPADHPEASLPDPEAEADHLEASLLEDHPADPEAEANQPDPDKLLIH